MTHSRSKSSGFVLNEYHDCKIKSEENSVIKKIFRCIAVHTNHNTILKRFNRFVVLVSVTAAYIVKKAIRHSVLSGFSKVSRSSRIVCITLTNN